MTARLHPFPQRPGAAASMLATLGARLAAIAGGAPLRADAFEQAPDWEIDALGAALALDPFEREAVVFAAAAELHAGMRELVARIGEGPPSVGLVLRVCEGLEWGGFRPDGALRRARVLRLGNPCARLTERPVCVEEPVLHFLNSVRQLDERLAEIALPARKDEAACLDENALSEFASIFERHAAAPFAMPPLRLDCDEPGEGVATAIEALHRAGFGALAVSIASLPRAPSELAQLRGAWLRDSLLHRLGLVLVGDGRADTDTAHLLTGWTSPALLVSAGEHGGLTPGPRITLAAERAPQRESWERRLGEAGVARHAPIIDRLAFSFRLSSDAIATLAERHRNTNSPVLWAAARAAARPRDERLIERIEPRARLEDVVLPENAKNTLATLVAAARAHHKVAAAWEASGARGLGITALFAGESGAGKTMAAEGVANALAFDLYKVELSAVVSKYIGETEKNLRRVFAAAEASGGVLLFDEADVFFGKRSEVKDAHDRYANLEVGYLLQLMESYRGLAILTTNMEEALDVAFQRRLRFVLRFPLPGAAERARIWAGAFPPDVPVEPLDHTRLARLSITGGVIRNIALCASFRAAGAGRAVALADILDSARAEYLKLGRPLGEIDQKDWS